MTTSGFFPAGIPQASFDTSTLSPESSAGSPTLAGDGAAVRRLRLQIERIGPHFRTVLVRGEVGTGKELVARALHAKSDRAAGPFVICHAARISEIDEEAHSGDVIQAMAESAQEGTLYLDGVEEMSARAQKRLLRLLDRKTAPRMIAASSQDLRVLAAAGIFRHDVYHRLAMIEITLEPLRQRKEDIPTLVMHFLKRFASQYQKPVDVIARDAMEKLLLHEWPGNVRELENVLHNGVLQCEDTMLSMSDLSLPTGAVKAVGTAPPAELRQNDPPMRLQDVIDRHVLRVLRECSGNKVRAAEVLGISRSTLYRMLEGCSAQASESHL
jgi:DNA-binding NtrC family response regulator